MIPNAGLHEPRGVSTATAGDVYVANGSGSGIWKPPEVEGQAAATAGQILYATGSGGVEWRYFPSGWGFYSDAETSPATQVFNTTPTKIQIDGGGSTTETGYLPAEIRASGDLWDAATDKITPIRVGDAYDLRLGLTCSAITGSPSYLELKLDIGGTTSPTIVIAARAISIYRTPPFDVSVAFPIFTLATFVANGGQLFLNTDAGTATISTRNIFLSRNHDGNF